MVRAYYNQEQFNYGQLGKLMRGRRDTGVYRAGAKTMVNYRPSIQGPAIKRKGTRFVREVKTSANATRLIPFVFSEDDSIIIELGNLYARFYKNGAVLGAPYELTTPYTTADLPNIKFTQIGDIMYLSAGGSSIRPQKLTRIADTNWTIVALDNQLGPVEDFNDGSTTITLSGTLTKGGTSTWTASANTFVSSDVGSVWAIAKHDDKSIIGYARMAGFSSATVATFTNQTDLTAVTTTASLNWREPTWSNTKGYPKAVASHEDRVYWGGTSTYPLNIVGSVTSSYENYDIDDATADDGLNFNLAGQINDIEWLASDGEFLVAGTLGGLGFVEINISGDAVSPRARFGTNAGASAIQGVKMKDQIVYAHNSNKHIYQANYNDISLKYVSTRLTDINPDIIENGITNYMATIEQPDSIAYMVSNGDLKGMLYDPNQEQSVVGFHSYEFTGDVESVASIPSTTGQDQIWLIIKRTINGATKRYVEYIDNSDNEIYVDSAVVYSGSATRSLTGLSHLEGETVRVWGDGADFGEFVVNSGTVTIPTTKSAVENAYIGYGYNADLEIMPIDIPVPQTGGTTQTLKARINEVIVILYDTLGLEYGEAPETLQTLPFRSSGDAMDGPPGKAGEVYPEEKQLTFTGNWSRAPSIYLRSSGPFPCIIISLMARMEVNSN